MLLEIGLIFAVFVIQGAEPVPDVNEPYYLGKAIHYWNPDWVRGDFFLDTSDSHTVFYFTFGWLALLLPPAVFGWVGRLATWGLLAWAWRRLSFALVPRRWFAILTAALWVCLVEHAHMAGEWVVGGVEAKGFAFVLVLLGLEALVDGKWNRVWLLLGAASAFHVLVGGWSVVAAGLVWLVGGRSEAPLRTTWPWLAGGFALSLPGLLPVLLLDTGTDPQIVAQAHEIYVYLRLSHHLAPLWLPVAFVYRFFLLCVLWLALCGMTPLGPRGRRLQGFVGGALVIALAGALLSFVEFADRSLAASLLRFYWFRLADVAVPLGTAMAGTAFIVFELGHRQGVGRRWLVLALLVAAVHLGHHACQRVVPRVPPADRLPDYVAWWQACDFVATSGEIPPDARFLTPRLNQTFKWYARRAEVANWKEIPQDAEAIVDWWKRICDVHATGRTEPGFVWYPWLADRDEQRLRQLGAKYDANYLITVSRRPLDLPVMYRNRTYAVYCLE